MGREHRARPARNHGRGRVAALEKRSAADPARQPLRGLVNNAGVGVNAPIETLPHAEWRELFETNLFGHIAIIQVLLPMLIEGAGTVVNVSSIGGKKPMEGDGPYAVTKSGWQRSATRYAVRWRRSASGWS